MVEFFTIGKYRSNGSGGITCAVVENCIVEAIAINNGQGKFCIPFCINGTGSGRSISFSDCFGAFCVSEPTTEDVAFACQYGKSVSNILVYGYVSRSAFGRSYFTNVVGNGNHGFVQGISAVYLIKGDFVITCIFAFCDVCVSGVFCVNCEGVSTNVSSAKNKSAVTVGNYVAERVGVSALITVEGNELVATVVCKAYDKVVFAVVYVDCCCGVDIVDIFDCSTVFTFNACAEVCVCISQVDCAYACISEGITEYNVVGAVGCFFKTTTLYVFGNDSFGNQVQQYFK